MNTDGLTPSQRFAAAYSLALAEAEQSRWEASMQRLRDASGASADECAAMMAAAIRGLASVAEPVSGDPGDAPEETR